MKKFMKLAILALLTLCVFVLGGWTTDTQHTERYADAPVVSKLASETVNFYSRTVDKYYTPGGFPIFNQPGDMTNGCGAVAGAGIISYYDKYYPDMIPNWNSYYPASGVYRLQDSEHIVPIMWELYDLMRTNVDDVGVSEQEFISGLKTFINNQGYSVNMQNVVSGSNFDYATCKNAIDNNKVVALLAHAGDIYSMAEMSTYDIIASTTIAGSHIMVAYGYHNIKYYDKSGNLFRNDIYLDVATGFDASQTALYKINPHNLSAAYIVNIS